MGFTVHALMEAAYLSHFVQKLEMCVLPDRNFDVARVVGRTYDVRVERDLDLPASTTALAHCVHRMEVEMGLRTSQLHVVDFERMPE